MNYPFIEVSMRCSDADAMTQFWCDLFDAKVLFKGRMMDQPFSRVLVCGVTLVFRQDPNFKPPPGPGEEWLYNDHLGLRVASLDEAIAALEAKGARFVLTPARVRALQRSQGQGGQPLLETTYVAPPLTLERLKAGDLRHDVAILVGPDNLWIELNEIHEPQDTQWYPGAECHA
ncbi:VOC family protein [Myxococcota bacterium]|nr:VOC family protein [Myxococcota bacterium]MBU1429819.1 VOC family protein [Myxococcota bacterium]MBU1898498.1 VOC family protein [Myxococcota bacterium]